MAEAVPHYEVDPYWPKPLPENWIIGQVAGVAVDRRNHVWVVHRPRSLTERETGAAQDPPWANDFLLSYELVECLGAHTGC